MSATNDIGRLQYLERIAETASNLEYWLGRNVGDNADWPVSIKADQEGANKLCSLLMDLQEALMPYRRSSGKLMLSAPMNPDEFNPDEGQSP